MWQTVPDLNSSGTVGRKQAGPGGRIRYEKPPLGSSEDNTHFSFSIHIGFLKLKRGVSIFKVIHNEMVFKFPNFSNFSNFQIFQFFPILQIFHFFPIFRFLSCNMYLDTNSLVSGGRDARPEGSSKGICVTLKKLWRTLVLRSFEVCTNFTAWRPLFRRWRKFGESWGWSGPAYRFSSLKHYFILTIYYTIPEKMDATKILLHSERKAQSGCGRAFLDIFCEFCP